jgi:apolipoprotein D and lipocalin family protein
VHRLILLVLLLAGCAAGRQGAMTGVYRDPAVPIYSAAVFDRNRFAAADWQQVAAFLPGPPETCSGTGLAFPEPGNPARASYRLCLSGALREGAGAVAFEAGGRFALPGIDEPLWVLWVDADYRTVLVGTPSGRLGFILNRGGPLSQDRLAAAREILDFNGYDLSRLFLWR